MNLKTVEGVIFFTEFMVIGSNLICNVPLTILVVKEFNQFVYTTGALQKEICYFDNYIVHHCCNC